MLTEQKKALCSYSIMVIIFLGVLTINFHKPLKTMSVILEPLYSTIYFAGVVIPINTYNVVSPIDGTVLKINALYGDKVTKGQRLFVIRSSNETEVDMLTSLESYIKARTNSKNAQFKDYGNAQLYKSGLLSKLSYMDSQDQVQNAKLDQWSAEQKLQKILSYINISIRLFDNLTVEKIPEMEPILRRAMREVVILSPEDGTLLFPSKALGITDPDVKSRLRVGDSIKAEHPLGIIANMKGIQIEINILETNYHQVHKGDKVTITGQAFPGVILTGYIYSINSQANNADSNTSPTYTGFVRATQLTKKQRDLIEVGMSVDVALTKKTRPLIKVPLEALIERNGQYWVKVLKNKKEITEVQVTPDLTDPQFVVITHGLSVGDEIVLPD